MCDFCEEKEQRKISVNATISTSQEYYFTLYVYGIK